jgi:hypothetical protein
MSSVNKVILIGNLGKDPEVRYTQGGDPVCNFTMATTEKWKDKSGEKQEKTEWHRLTAFGRSAEVLREGDHQLRRERERTDRRAARQVLVVGRMDAAAEAKG